MMSEFGFGGGDDGLDTGTFPTVIKFNAKENKWSTYAGEGVWNDVTFPEKILVDMPNFKRGWFKFDSDGKPVKVFARWDKPCPENPDGPKIIEGGFKPSFEVNMYSKDFDFVVFSSQSLCVIRAMQAVLNTWEQREDQSPTKVPGCVMEIDEITTKHGRVYVPNFKIKAYVDRPLNLIGSDDQHPQTANTAPKAESKPKAKPAPKPAPVEPEFDDDLDKVFPDKEENGDDYF